MGWADIQKRMWADPSKRGYILAPASMQPGNDGAAKTDKVSDWLKGLSKYGPKGHEASGSGNVEKTMQTLGMSRSSVSDADAALLHLYEGDPAMQAAILARVRASEGAAGLVEDVAAVQAGGAIADAAAPGTAEAAAAIASAEAAAGAAPAAAAAGGNEFVENALAKIATLEPTERTAVLADAVQAAGATGATSQLDAVLEAAIRSTPKETAYDAIAVALQKSMARAEAAKATTAAAAAITSDAPVVEKVAPAAAKATGIFARGLGHAAPAVGAAIEHSTPAIEAAVEHAAAAAPLADHASSIVDLAEHAGAVGDAAEGIAALAEHAGTAIEHAAQVESVATTIARKGASRLWSIDDIAREAMRLGPYIRA